MFTRGYFILDPARETPQKAVHILCHHAGTSVKTLAAGAAGIFVSSGFAGLQRSTPPVFIREIERKPMEFPLLNTTIHVNLFVVGRKKVSARGVWVFADPEMKQWAGKMMDPKRRE